MKLNNSFVETASILLCIQKVVASNPLRALFTSQSSDSFVNDPVGVVSANGRVNVRNPRILQVTDDFLPLTCNTVNEWNCEPWPFGEIAGDVVVPCDVCYTMESYTSVDTVVTLSTLNIKGKLEFPDGTEVTLKTTGIIVQGELSITSTKVVDGNPAIVFQFNGDVDVNFFPDAPNADACGQQGCNLGIKPFVVAGGKVHIHGLPDNCLTWTTMVDIIADGNYAPLSYPQFPDLPTPSEGVCSNNTLISQGFEFGLNKWYGNAGAEESIKEDGGGNYLHIGRRTHIKQGPMLDLSPLIRECLITDQDYLFSAKIRIIPGPEFEGANSACHLTGSSCPKLEFSHMDKLNSVRWRELIATDSSGIQDNLWFEINRAINIPSNIVPAGPYDVYSLFSINGVEPGVDISIDDISIELPPPEAYPVSSSDACTNLVINGGADQFGKFTYPLRPYMKQSVLTIKEEDGNSYFSITRRTLKYDSIAVDLNPECLQTSSIYLFSAKIRLHSVGTDYALVKLVSKIPGQSGYHFDIVENKCPETSSNLGWVTCETIFAVSPDLSTASQVQLLIMFAKNEVDDADFDDISFTFQNAMKEGQIELKDDLSSCYAPGAKVLLPSDNLNFNSEQIVTLQAISGGNFISLEEDIVRTSTYNNDPDFPTEFAILSRNILFENNDADHVGPSLVVLNTPNIEQHIQGVDFYGFGRASLTNGYPINFLSSRSSSTIVSKNTIQHSNNGCINIEATHEIIVSENVAYDSTRGHCFYLKSGVGNSFEKNLGAVTRTDSSLTEFATFYIGHPSNKFTGNVAAGSQRNGFYVHSREEDMLSFIDNVAHSNSQYGIKSLYKPLNINTWSNTKVYRNMDKGILFRESRNILFDGGVIADNRIGIDIWGTNGITISGIKIMGFSEAFKNIAEVVPSTWTHCPDVAPMPIYGIRLHVNGMSTINSEGTKIENATFSGFVESTGCNPSSSAMIFNSLASNPSAYTTTTKVSQTSFDETSTSRDVITLCETFTEGLFDVYVTDDGSLNPLGDESGLVISNNSTLDIAGSCTPMHGSCAQYCLLKTSGENSAPAAGPPVQTPSVSTNSSGLDSSVNKTSVGCITNGDFENGIDGWEASHSSPLVIVEGIDGTNALKAAGRAHQVRGGPSQEFSPDCFTDGDWYEVTLDVKITKTSDNSIFDCDPTYMYYSDYTCAGIHFLVGNQVKQIAYTLAPLRNNNGWNKIYGVFKATSDIMDQPSIDLIVSRAPISADITIDNLLISKAGPEVIEVKDCSNPLSNGDAEIGDARDWWIRGHEQNDSIQMGSPGYGNSKYAFKHMGTRQNRYYSMVQIMDGSCFEMGSTWTITAQFRFFNSAGVFVTCNKNNPNSKTGCPVFTFFAGNENTGALQNQDTTTVTVGDWNRIENTFTVNAEMATQLEMWVNVHAPIDYNYEIDDIQLVKV